MIIAAAVLFIAILAALILVHEWGHFFTARKAGIKVEEFGFGFPPKAFSVVKNGVIYSLNWVPLGGFVKIFGENGEGQNDPASFGSKSVLTRLIVVLAGVTMNVVMAIVLLSFGFWYGLPGVVDGQEGARIRDVKISITQIAPSSPAEHAGVKVGDAVVSFADDRGARTEAGDVASVQSFITEHKGKEITLTLSRGDETVEKKVTPRTEIPEGQGALGVALEKTGIISYPWYLAPVKGAEATFSLGWLFLSTFGTILGHLFTEGKLVADIAGPVGIGALTYQVTQLGLSYIIQFAAILSINLAIINALPFPALDGGRALFLIIEGIKGSPVSQRFEQIAHTAGFAFLILLMILVTVRDVIRLF